MRGLRARRGIKRDGRWGDEKGGTEVSCSSRFEGMLGYQKGARMSFWERWEKLTRENEGENEAEGRELESGKGRKGGLVRDKALLGTGREREWREKGMRDGWKE